MDSQTIPEENQQVVLIDEELQTKPSLLSRLLFINIYSLINKQDFNENCVEDLQLQDCSEVKHKQFKQYFLDNIRSSSLVEIIFKFFFFQLLKAFILQFILLLSQLGMPFLTMYIIEYINQKQNNQSNAIILIIMVLLIRIVNLLSMSHARQLMKIYGYEMMSTLSLEIMNKCLKISLLSNTERTIGEITNLIQVDVQRLIQVPNNLTNLAIIPIQLSKQHNNQGISLYYIYKQIGICVVVGIIIIILSILQNHYVGTQIVKAQSKVLIAKDNRVKTTTEVFSLIKFIKINALEQFFLTFIYQLREQEILTIRNRLKYFSINVFMGWLSPQLILSFTFGMYVLLDNDLVPSKTFPIIGLLSMLAASLQLLPISLNDLLETRISLRRIQKFFETDELMNECIQHFQYRDSKIAIQIDKGNFQWRKKEQQKFDNYDQPVILKNISLLIPPGQFVSVIGDVGSGKSSLIYALLGEMIQQNNQKNSLITIYGSIAYVGQKAWIMNASVRENILFGNQYNKQFYDQAIKYSCLTQDLEILINGDETMVGEKGINLSGGQKARISLARALYSEAEIFLLDDPLSAVDAHVGNFIMKECFLNLIKNKTRVLITHALNYCKFTDFIYLMQNGEIIESGKYSEMQNSTKFQEIESKFSGTTVQPPSNTKDQVRKASLSASKEKKVVEIQKDEQFNKQQKNDLILLEDKKTGNISQEVYTKYLLFNNSWFNQIILFIVMMIWIVSQIIASLWIAKWTSKYANPNDPFSDQIYFWVFLFLGIIQAVFAYIRAVLIVSQSMNSSQQIHNEMINCLVYAPQCSFFERVPLGRIMNRLTKDINSLDVEIHINIAQFSTKISQILSNNLLSIYTSTPYLIFPMMIFFYICFKIQRLYMKTSRELQRLDLISRSPILSHFTQTLMGLPTIRAFQQCENFMSSFSKKLDKNRAIVQLSTAVGSWFLQILGLTSLIVNMTAIIYCILYTNNPAFAGLILTFATNLDRNIQQTVDSLSLLENNMISFERCLEYTKIEQEDQSEKQKVDSTWPSQGQIEFKNFSTNYRDNLPCALKNLSFKIAPKEKIGIVGRTGAGKSSITLCLLRILEAIDGQILIDDQNIQEVQIQRLRNSITTILQDAIIFSGTIRQNLDPQNKCSMEEILQVIQDCCLNSLLQERDGLNTYIQEGGDNLSAGEKQLICIARAVLKKNKIILIDEATANIDIETEQKIQQTIINSFRNCTVITIAHRINTILHCDKILVMDQGEVKEFDETNKLLSNQKSLFYKIYQEANNQSCI